MTKVQPPPAPGGRFAKDRFTIDLAAETVTCPGQVSVAIRPVKNGGGVAAFGTACAGCPLAAQCTTSPAGRTITISAYEAQLARARAAQADPAWQADYTRHPTQGRTQDRAPDAASTRRPTRPRPRHAKVAADFALLAAAVNLARSACSAYGTPAEVGPPLPHDHRNSLLGSQFQCHVSTRSERVRRISPTRHQPDTNRHNRHTRSADNTYPTEPVWHQPPSGVC